MNLLYTSHFFASYQCDSTRCFRLDFGQQSYRLSFCQLLALRQKVKAIDLDAHFDSSRNSQGIEIITLCNRQHILILDTLEVIDLKDLLKATFGVMELNAIVAPSI